MRVTSNKLEQVLVLILVVGLGITACAGEKIALSRVSIDGIQLDAQKSEVFAQLGWTQADEVTAVPPGKGDFEVSFKDGKTVEVQGATLVIRDVVAVSKGSDFKSVEKILGVPDSIRNRDSEVIYRWQQDGWWLQIVVEPTKSLVERIKIRKGLLPS